MSSSVYDDLGKLILRLGLGILLLLHGLSKLDGGVGWIVGMLGQRGLPGFVRSACAFLKTSGSNGQFQT